ncbi:MAG: DUF2568 domain-containing protein [Actinomycetota bacterium]|nr:DUF2568 domain-containing protein [Actinomycetota bacterium]
MRRTLSGRNSPRTPQVGWGEVGYFLAEVAVYVSIAWWGLTRTDSLLPGLLLAAVLLILFAASWGLLVSPKAKWPLRGVADSAFRVVWFACGLAAAITVALGS